MARIGWPAGLVLLAWGCGEHPQIRPAVQGAAGFTADTASSAGAAQGATAIESACRALPDALWVNAHGRQECLRTESFGLGSAAGRTALILVAGDAPGAAYRSIGGRQQVEGLGERYETNSGDSRRAAGASLGARYALGPVVLIGRPGLRGSTGHHARDRHTVAEVELMDAALTELQRRHGIRSFALYGFSSGGVIVANLLAKRRDIGCAVIASAPLDLKGFYRVPDGAVPDDWAMRQHQLADPMRTVSALDARSVIVVLGDPLDRKVPVATWMPWVDAARRAGNPVVAQQIGTGDGVLGRMPRDHHRPLPQGFELLRQCAARGSAALPFQMIPAETAPGLAEDLLTALE